MKRKILLIVICLSIKATILSAQEYIYKQFTTENGLPSSEVYHVFQDSKGYIWFATDNGVSRYNGYEFENFDVNDGLPENAISEIYEDYKGRIWFIGITVKLSYFQQGRIVPFEYNKLIYNILQKNPIYLKGGFFIDSSSNMYISVKGNGLIELSEKGLIQQLKENPPTSNTLEIHELPCGKKMVATFNNRDFKFNKISYVLKNQKKEIIIPEADGIYPQHSFLIELQDSAFFISVVNHLYAVNNMKIHKSFNFGDRIIWMKQDLNNNLWICPFNKGAFCYKMEKKKLIETHHVLNGQTVTSVLQDNYGSYWFSTINNGVFYIQSIDLININKKAGLLDDITKCVEIHNDTIWVGYNLNKISEIRKDKITEYRFSGVFSYSVNTMYFEDRTNQLLVPTSGYLFFIRNNKVTEFRNNFVSIKEPNTRTFIATDIIPDKDEGFWISGGDGFFHLKNKIIDFDSEQSEKLRIRINSILLNNNNSLWLGCKDGLRSFKTNQLRYWGDKYEKLASNILDILEYNHNTLILATKGKGILFFNGDTVLQIRKSEGLISNTITCMALQGNTLWTGSLNGLDRIELPDSLYNTKQIKILNLNELAGFEINQIKLYDSSLYVASNKGVIIWPLSKINNFNPSIPFAFKNMTINGIAGAITNEYRLSYEQNNFTISFEALLYSTKTQIQYKYCLSGLDTNWIYTTNREARYYRVPPGKYVFKAMVKNRAGEWSNNSILIKIDIIPAIWQTTAFKIALGIIILTLILIAFKVSIISSRNKAVMKKSMYSYMMQALVNQMNPHFIFNTLNSINNFILTNDKRAASSYLTKFSKLMRNILENSRNDYITLAEEINALELYLEIESLRLKNKFDYSINWDDDINIFELKLPSLLIQPFIENSIWHGLQASDRYGVIKVKITKNENLLVFDIIDNGIGRYEAQKKMIHSDANKKSLGSKITIKRLAALARALKSEAKAEYTDLYSDKKCIGTKVSVTIPVIT